MKRMIMLLTGLCAVYAMSLPVCAAEPCEKDRAASRCEAVEGMYSLDSDGRIVVSRVIGTFGEPAEEGYKMAMNIIENELSGVEYVVISDNPEECMAHELQSVSEKTLGQPMSC